MLVRVSKDIQEQYYSYTTESLNCGTDFMLTTRFKDLIKI